MIPDLDDIEEYRFITEFMHLNPPLRVKEPIPLTISIYEKDVAMSIEPAPALKVRDWCLEACYWTLRAKLLEYATRQAVRIAFGVADDDEVKTMAALSEYLEPEPDWRLY